VEFGRRVYDERHLCHSPQERLFIDGAWQEGLVPAADAGSDTLGAYRHFAQRVNQARRTLGFAIPSARAPWGAGHQALDAITFAHWLDREGLRDPLLRSHLDYCCRDDYGAGIDAVSAWAGLHYFASRHGFHAHGDDEGESERLLTWPEGNAWLAERMAAPLATRVRGASVVWRVEAGKHGVQVDAWNAASNQSERWLADHVVLATPLFIAARVLVNAPEALTAAASRLLHAPWLVANLHVDAPLLDRRGFPPAWDNVVHGSDWLGYADAMHQSTRPHAGPTVLTLYRALGAGTSSACRAARDHLLALDAQQAANAAVDALASPHPDLRPKLRRVDLMRYGHAMPIPTPGLRGDPALQALARTSGRVHFAHSELSAYSIFEEALYQGCRAAQSVLSQRRK
jgi:hypothetical protein